MTIRECVAALLAIEAIHGDLHVLHHDDWDHFLVERIEVEPDEHLTYVLVTGENRRLKRGELTDS